MNINSRNSMSTVSFFHLSCSSSFLSLSHVVLVWWLKRYPVAVGFLTFIFLFSLPQPLRLQIRDFNPHIVCSLCAGYYIDATTITECLHTCEFGYLSFQLSGFFSQMTTFLFAVCKSCIVKYLQCNKCCPQCTTKIHETQPFLNLKPDRVLQDIVFKLVPGLYESMSFAEPLLPVFECFIIFNCPVALEISACTYLTFNYADEEKRKQEFFKSRGLIKEQKHGILFCISACIYFLLFCYVFFWHRFLL